MVGEDCSSRRPEGYRVYFYRQWRTGGKGINEYGGSVIGPHEESSFSGALGIWGKITNSRILDDVIEREEGGQNTDLVER